MSNQLLLRRRMMTQSKKDNILTFTAETTNSSVQLTVVGTPPALTLEYNNGGGWLPYTVGDVINLPNVGDKVKMRGNNAIFSTSTNDYYKFVIAGYVAASGDVTSLQNEIGGDIVLTSYCYRFMFSECTGLTQAPMLPSTTLANNCYHGMFDRCTSLTTPPTLPATTLASYCYAGMFNRCTGLTTAPSLPSTTLPAYCYKSMFNRCTGLTTAPELPATTLYMECYDSMFYGCTGLTMAPELPATTLANGCYNAMFYDCTHITSHHVATLNNSGEVFYSNTSCTSFTIYADTPPTIGSSTITGLKADCKIYVPYSADHSILDAYKAKQYWSDRAEYIFELDENGEIPS